MSKIKIWLGLATFVGTVVGVGMFSLPYLAAQTSFSVIFVYLIIVSGLMILLQLAYGEVVLATKGFHQMPGYAALYLGPRWRVLTFFIQVLSLVGGLTAYLVVGGEFLWLLVSPALGGPLFLYVLVYFISGALLVYVGIKSVAKSELLMLFVLLALVILFVVSAWTKIDWALLTAPMLESTKWFLPYGAVLFALSGATVIPEVAEIVGNQHRHLRSILIFGSLLVVLIYISFIISIFGLSGSQTAPDALSSLAAFASPTIFKAALVFGLLATFTSFISLASVIKQSLQEDWRVSPFHAWLVACFPALILYLAGLQNFIKIISLTGAVGFAFASTVIFLMYLKVKKSGGQKKSDYQLILPTWLIAVLIIALLIGAGAEIISLFK